MVIGDKLKRLRETKKLSRREIEKRMGLPRWRKDIMNRSAPKLQMGERFLLAPSRLHPCPRTVPLHPPPPAPPAS
jgi:transcriptional regulator with XRE-family HTH domain